MHEKATCRPLGRVTLQTRRACSSLQRREICRKARANSEFAKERCHLINYSVPGSGSGGPTDYYLVRVDMTSSLTVFDCRSRCRIIVCPSSSRARLLFSELTAYTMCWDDSLRSEPASIDAQRLHSTRRASLSCRAAFPLLVRLSMSVPGRLLPLVEDVKPEDTACVPLRGSGTLPHRWKSRGTQGTWILRK